MVVPGLSPGRLELNIAAGRIRGVRVGAIPIHLLAPAGYNRGIEGYGFSIEALVEDRLVLRRELQRAVREQDCPAAGDILRCPFRRAESPAMPARVVDRDCFHGRAFLVAVA